MQRLFLAIVIALAAPVGGQAWAASQDAAGLSAQELFALSDQLAERQESAAAIQIYLALAQDPDVVVRNEARFRHAQLLTVLGQPFPAIALYRAILEEQPETPRVRLELANLLATVGDRRGAEQEFAQVQRTPLPPEIARAVRQYRDVLREARPFGASLEVALAPSTNINRATTSTTLDTVIAPFTLSEDARAQSGTGLRIGAQGRARLNLSGKTQAVGRLSTQASLYKQRSFDDVVASAELGVVRTFGKVEVRPLVGRSYRWFGREPYATTDTLTLALARPVGEMAQVSSTLGAGRADYVQNRRQNGDILTGDVLYERAFSPKFGGGLGVSYDRQGAADPGYATTSNGVQVLAWRRLGDMSLFVNTRASHLVADKRLGLFQKRREDRQYQTTFGVTATRFKIRSLAPTIRVTYESTASTVGIYDYDRWGADLSFSRAF